MNNKLTINELEDIFKMVIAKLRLSEYSSTAIDQDYYREVLGESRYNFDVEPDLSIGSLVDDISSLRNSIREGEIISFTDFDRVSAFLYTVSETLAPSTAN